MRSAVMGSAGGLVPMIAAGRKGTLQSVSTRKIANAGRRPPSSFGGEGRGEEAVILAPPDERLLNATTSSSKTLTIDGTVWGLLSLALSSKGGEGTASSTETFDLPSASSGSLV